MEETSAQEKSSNTALWWVLGCGLAFLLGVGVVCGGGLLLGYRFFDQKLPELVASGIRSAVDESSLPEDDKRAIRDEVDRVTLAYREDRIGLEDLGKLAETLAEGGVFHVGLIHALRNAVRASPELSAEEKLAAETTLTRAERGIWDHSIPLDAVEDDLDLRVEKRGEGFHWETRRRSSWDDPEDLRRTLRGLQRAADEAGVPTDAEPVDLGGELAGLVDRALGVH